MWICTLNYLILKNMLKSDSFGRILFGRLHCPRLDLKALTFQLLLTMAGRRVELFPCSTATSLDEKFDFWKL